MEKKKQVTIGIIVILALIIIIIIIIITIFDIGDEIKTQNSNTPKINIPFVYDTTTIYRDSIFEEHNKKAEVNQPASFECMGCHDGVIASDKGLWSVFGSFSNHPIGMYYNNLNTELHSSSSPSGLGGSIREDLLENGFVGCTSCHYDHNEDGTELGLKINNKNSELCLVCHNI